MSEIVSCSALVSLIPTKKLLRFPNNTTFVIIEDLRVV